MIRWFMSHINKGPLFLAAVLTLQGWMGQAWAAPDQREPITMRVVAVNPSEEKTRTIPVRIDLPMEVTPAHVTGASR